MSPGNNSRQYLGEDLFRQNLPTTFFSTTPDFLCLQMLGLHVDSFENHNEKEDDNKEEATW